MKTRSTSLLVTVTLAFVSLALPSFAQEKEKEPKLAPSPVEAQAALTAKPSDAEMMAQMMALAKLNENHKLLADLAGSWTDEVKMFMAPGAPPMTSKGTAVRKAIMGGRFFATDFEGTMKMPDEKGQLKNVAFKGISLEGYDNVKKKFVSTWADNMGTGILMSEGDYDPATKSFTYTAEMEMMPGVKTRVREVIKMIDKNHHVFEWYEDRGGKEEKTMEITYTRKK